MSHLLKYKVWFLNLSYLAPAEKLQTENYQDIPPPRLYTYMKNASLSHHLFQNPFWISGIFLISHH